MFDNDTKLILFENMKLTKRKEFMSNMKRWKNDDKIYAVKKKMNRAACHPKLHIAIVCFFSHMWLSVQVRLGQDSWDYSTLFSRTKRGRVCFKFASRKNHLSLYWRRSIHHAKDEKVDFFLAGSFCVAPRLPFSWVSKNFRSSKKSEMILSKIALSFSRERSAKFIMGNVSR